MSEQSCTCFQGHAPCPYCERTIECQGCGKLYFDKDANFDDVDIPVCPPCQDKYRHVLAGHALDCTCKACLAFVNEDDAEAGFKVAIPILIEEADRLGCVAKGTQV